MPPIDSAREQAQPPSDSGAEDYLQRVRAKINKLAEDFAQGTINRGQFQQLYSHYQRERQTVENLIEARDEQWRNQVTEGASVVIRQKHLARARGYAIYENDSGMPITTLGEFELDPALVVPMLSSYRAATQEIFGAGMRSTEIEGGRWLCFVPGRHSTLMAVFSSEPADKQRQVLEELHRLFEKANERPLAASPVHADELLFPHEFFLGMWKKS